MERNLQAVCNTILAKAQAEQKPISPMKLQKLLYMIQKDFLKKAGNCIFAESFEAWPYGPVLPSVYFEFAPFRSSPIDRFVKDEDGNTYSIETDNDSMAARVINDMWNKYKDYTGIDLSRMTHQADTAWTKAHTQGNHALVLADILGEADFG